MDTEIIAEVAGATLARSIAFPEVVRRLIETGVEYYVTLRKTFYSATGDVMTTPIPYEGLPPVPRISMWAGARGDSGQPAARSALSGFYPARDGGRRARLHRGPARAARDLLG